MAFLLRQIVASPRAQHEGTGLDLCYVTSDIIVTSGPSQTYPQRAYRNPLDRLVAFLDEKHSNGWAIWEFRAEGTGYPDESVYGRIRHYPWPDHHPPPFRLVPMILASMRNWLAGGDDPQHRRHLLGHLGGGEGEQQWQRQPQQQQREQEQERKQKHQQQPHRQEQQQDHLPESGANQVGHVEGEEASNDQGELREVRAERDGSDGSELEQSGRTDSAPEKSVTPDKPSNGSSNNNTKDTPARDKRVVVVHCKAGKGRSGSMAVSYLIAEAGWTAEDALARFTQRRMRPQFGSGVSIPSQLRWVHYVDRWARGGKRPYVDRPVEVVEIHVWGLRQGVKVSVEGFADEGKKIRTLHTFSRDERIVVEGDAPAGGGGGFGGGVMAYLYNAAGYYGAATGKAPAAALVDGPVAEEVREDVDYHDVVGGSPGGQTTWKKDQDAAATAEAGEKPPTTSETGANSQVSRSKSNKMLDRAKASSLMRKLSSRKASKSISTDSASSSSAAPSADLKSEDLITVPSPSPSSSSPAAAQARTDSPALSLAEPGGRAVILRPRQPVRVPTSDVNVSVERRNRAPGGVMGLTMVTAVAHAWFNAFFEGGGGERARPDESGVFEIAWDALDGLKGSSQKGTRACDRLAVVWRFARRADGDRGDGHGEEASEEGGAAAAAAAGKTESHVGGEGAEQAKKQKKEEGDFAAAGEGHDVLSPAARTATAAASRPDGEGEAGQGLSGEPGVVVVNEPGPDDTVPEMAAADWKGGNDEDPDNKRRLGLRKQSPDSADMSRASSVERTPLDGAGIGRGDGEGGGMPGSWDGGGGDGDDDSLKGVKTSGPLGEERLDERTGIKD